MHSLPGQPKYQREGFMHGLQVSKPNAGQEGSKAGKKSASFCEQKEAKNFVSSGPVPFPRHRPKPGEVFAPLFSKSGHFLNL
jgi:hypothetical protein